MIDNGTDKGLCSFVERVDMAYSFYKKMCFDLQLLLFLFLCFSDIFLPLLLKRQSLRLWWFKWASTVWLSPMKENWLPNISRASRKKQRLTLTLGWDKDIFSERERAARVQNPEWLISARFYHLLLPHFISHFKILSPLVFMVSVLFSLIHSFVAWSFFFIPLTGIFQRLSPLLFPFISLCIYFNISLSLLRGKPQWCQPRPVSQVPAEKPHGYIGMCCQPLNPTNLKPNSSSYPPFLLMKCQFFSQDRNFNIFLAYSITIISLPSAYLISWHFSGFY